MERGKLAEMVEAEAVVAEAENPDEPAAPEPEPEPAPEPEPEPDPEPVAQALDPVALEKALRAHEKAMRKVMGADFEHAAVCESCGGVGYTPEGQEVVPPIKQGESFSACEACNGYGQVLTGAREPGNTTSPCTVCAGGGYVTKAETYAPPIPPGLPTNGEPMALPRAPQLVIDPSQLDALRAAGYTVIDPYVPAA